LEIKSEINDHENQITAEKTRSEVVSLPDTSIPNEARIVKMILIVTKTAMLRRRNRPMRLSNVMVTKNVKT